MKLDNRIKELIAIGASITANCQLCLEYHVGKAQEYGADTQEVAEAIAVGKTVRQEAARKMDRFASTVKQASASAARDADCGCSSSSDKSTVSVDLCGSDCDCKAFEPTNEVKQTPAFNVHETPAKLVPGGSQAEKSSPCCGPAETKAQSGTKTCRGVRR
ncbi:MAG: carboxymuconolactone decarboxylase family protein [Dehalococcoidia bacterium]|nr:carboxymuconolactone decarboxylase family protein [Dehalococcoidia bacterium]